MPSSVPFIFAFFYLLYLKAESTAGKAALLGPVTFTITEKQRGLPAGGAWMLKPILIIIFVFDQQKSASSINSYSHQQALLIVPQSRCPRGAAGRNPSDAAGCRPQKSHLVPNSNTVKSGRAFVSETPPLRKHWAVVCRVFGDTEAKVQCPVCQICCKPTAPSSSNGVSQGQSRATPIHLSR